MTNSSHDLGVYSLYRPSDVVEFVKFGRWRRFDQAFMMCDELFVPGNYQILSLLQLESRQFIENPAIGHQIIVASDHVDLGLSALLHFSPNMNVLELIAQLFNVHERLATNNGTHHVHSTANGKPTLTLRTVLFA